MLLCAGATNFEMFRLGTSGGIGVQPGTVIVSNGAINTALEPFRYQWIGGELVRINFEEIVVALTPSPKCPHEQKPQKCPPLKNGHNHRNSNKDQIPKKSTI